MRQEDLGESLSADDGTTKGSLEGKIARNPTALRLKVQKYVTTMARRATRQSTNLLDDAKRLLNKARIEEGRLKVQVANSQSLVGVVQTVMGTSESVQQGQCVGPTCYRGIMFKASHEGIEETWICHRGINAHKMTRNAFACSMTTAEGAEHTCVGNELWYEDGLWVPFIKEVKCPEDITQPCRESKQCGSEGLPLTKDYVQKKLRNNCAQL